MIPSNENNPNMAGNLESAGAPGAQQAVLMPLTPTHGNHQVTWPIGEVPWNETPAATNGISPSSMVHALRRRWWLALGLGLVCAAAVSAALFVLVPINYESTAILQVSRIRPSVGNLNNNVMNLSLGEFEIYKKTQAQIIKSQFVLGKALEAPGIKSLKMISERDRKAGKYLEKELSVNLPGESEIMFLTLKSERPEEAQKMLQTIVDVYIREVVDREKGDRTAQLNNLKGQRKTYEFEIDEMLKSVNKTASDIGAADSPGAAMRQRLEIEKLGKLQLAVDKLELEQDAILRKTQLVAAMQVNRPDYNPTEAEIEEALERDVEYQKLLGKLSFMQDDFAGMVSTAGGATNAVSRSRSQVNAVQLAIQKRRSEMMPRIKEKLRSQMTNERMEEETLKMLEVDRRFVEAQLIGLRKKLSEQDQQVRNLAGFSADLERSKLKLDALRRKVAEMDLQIYDAQVEANARERVSVLQQADLPSGNDATMKYVKVGVGGLAALLLVMGLIAVVDAQSRRVNSSYDVSSGARIRVLGVLPQLCTRKAGFRRLPRQIFEGVLADSIDSIRTALVHARGHEHVDVVMITSASGQEGKTTVASQLAASLARAGRRTLLIDGDLRNPQQHKLFDRQFGAGLCELLGGSANLQELVQETEIPGLSLLTAGNFDEMTMQGWSSKIVQQAFDEMKTQFDFVVIDAGPVLTSPEPLLLGHFADVTILSARRDISRIPKVYEACDRLRAVGIPVMGAVLNGTETVVRHCSTARD